LKKPKYHPESFEVASDIIDILLNNMEELIIGQNVINGSTKYSYDHSIITSLKNVTLKM